MDKTTTLLKLILPKPPKTIIKVVVNQKNNTILTNVDVNAVLAMNDVQKSQVFSLLQTTLSAIVGRKVNIMIEPLDEIETGDDLNVTDSTEDQGSKQTHPIMEKDIQPPLSSVPAKDNPGSDEVQDRRHRKGRRPNPRNETAPLSEMPGNDK